MMKARRATKSSGSPTANSGNSPIRIPQELNNPPGSKDHSVKASEEKINDGNTAVELELDVTAVTDVVVLEANAISSSKTRCAVMKKKAGDGGGNKSLHKSINSTVVLSDEEDETIVIDGDHQDDIGQRKKFETDEDDHAVASRTVTTPKKCSSKSTLRVLPPEDGLGPVEYKRQIAEPTPKRLRTLATQMAFRIDEGRGTARYEVGVEDDGRHSMLDMKAIVQSVNVLEAMARTLNALVIEKIYYQNESSGDDSSDSNKNDGPPLKVVIMTTTQSLNDDGVASCHVVGRTKNTTEEQEEKKELSEDESTVVSTPTGAATAITLDCLSTTKPTRCTMTIRRIETHLLDVSPASLSEIANAFKKQQPSTEAATTKNDDAEKQVGEKTSSTASLSTASLNQKLAAAKLKDDDKSVPSNATISPAGNSVASVMSPGGAKVTPNHHGSSLRPPHSISDTMSKRNIRVAVVGNVDAGKSTLIGTLTTSCLDDGRGRSRSTIVKHRHEIETGRTSTATTHLMGFRSTGETISDQKDSVRAPHRSILKPEDEVARESFKVVTLMDLAGHEKYLKTTIHGVSSGFADYALILVNARHPPTHMTQHHINLCCSFGIPLIIVFTKVDGCPDHAMKTSKQELQRLLRSGDIHRRPFMIKGPKDVETCVDKMHSLAPMIETSCVSGKGLDLLKQLLFWLPRRRRHERKLDRAFEFLVEDIFHAVPGVAGSVVSGFVNAGELTLGPKGTEVFVGPTDDGTFLKTIAKSAHIARINTNHVTAGQNACLALSLHKELRKKLRRGMVVVSDPNANSTKEFDAEICVLKGDCTTIRENYQAYVHILNVRQSAFAKSIELVKGNEDAALIPHPNHRLHLEDEDDDEGRRAIVLRPGSRAKVRFEFAQRPEYIRPGMRMLFRDGRVRGVGIITRL